jgi:DNA-binding MarR family transcriptional regulator
MAISKLPKAPAKPAPRKPATEIFEPVSELESHVGFWLRYVSNHVVARFEELVAAYGVSISDWVALRFLYREGGATHGELIDTLGMTKGAVSKVISRLEEKGLVEKAAVTGDARVQRIVLAATGRALVPRLAALADQSDREFFGHLSKARQVELISVMKEMVWLHRLKQVPVE